MNSLTLLRQVNSRLQASLVRAAMGSVICESSGSSTSTDGLVPFEKSTVYSPTALHAFEQWSDVREVPDGSGYLIAVNAQFGATYGDFTQLIGVRRFSRDRGVSWEDATTVLSIEGTEYGNSPAALHIKSDNTIQLYFYRVEGVTNPVQTSLCVKESTDYGVTFGTTHTIFTGNYASPRVKCLTVANNGYVYIAWNIWFGSNSGNPYDYSSADGKYRGLIFRNTNDGTIANWDSGTTVNSSNDAVFENMITQYQNSAAGAAGRIVNWYRSRGSYMGSFYSDDNGATWSSGVLTVFPSPNSNLTVGYIYEADTVFVMKIADPPYHDRRRLELWASVDHGAVWTLKYVLNEFHIDGAGSWETLGITFYEVDGNFVFGYYESNATVTSVTFKQIVIPRAAIIDIPKYKYSLWYISNATTVAELAYNRGMTQSGALIIDQTNGHLEQYIDSATMSDAPMKTIIQQGGGLYPGVAPMHSWYNLNQIKASIQTDGLFTGFVGYCMMRYANDGAAETGYNGALSGAIYYNTTTNKFRGKENGSWVNLV